MKRLLLMSAGAALAIGALACATTKSPAPSAWERANPIEPLPAIPAGLDRSFAELKEPPTPERARLGRWLFFDTRLSADGTVSCATCHRPEYGFSEPTPHSTGIRGQQGRRKAPAFTNEAWTLYPHFFWDGRAASLEEQALGPVANPIEMGNTHDAMVRTLDAIDAYKPYFKEAFGTEEITKDRVARAIADYERTCLSGDSAWDRWKKNRDERAVTAEAKLGDSLFFGKAGCNQCHLGQNLTDSAFHNLGIGWDPVKKTFSDEGRYAVTKDDADRGAFKTPGLRDVALRAPYMHDGSVATLRDAVSHYNKGGNPNPYLDPKVSKLNLADADVDAIVKFLEALDSGLPVEKAPAAFPR